MSGYLNEPIKDYRNYRGAVRNIKNGKSNLKLLKDAFQRRGQSCQNVFRLLEIIIVLLNPHPLGYLIYTMREKQIKGVVRIDRNINYGQKPKKKIKKKIKKRLILKETAVLAQFFQGHWSDSSCSGVLTCQGTRSNQSKTMKTLNYASRLPSSLNITLLAVFRCFG